MREKRERFARLIGEKQIVVAPGVCDCIGALMVEQAGFPAVYLTGFGTSAALIGKPDLGFLSFGEALGHAERIEKATLLPVVADAEAGFGSAANTVRTVEEYERAGIAAIHLEDQINPKRWKPDGSPQVVSMEEHADKIRAAVRARRDPNFLIIGRTDAAERYGLAEAIRRAECYVEAGADLHFVHGLGDIQDLRRVAEQIHSPGVVNYSTIIESGNRPVSVSAFQKMGYRLVIFPTELLLGAAKSMRDILLHLRETGSIEGLQDRLLSIGEFKEVLHWSAYSDLEEKWLPEKDG
jgi:2-methylisocitrate lyase-like PEP mutase family enzyme